MKESRFAVILPSFLGLIFLSGSVNEYLTFVGSQGFSNIDIAFLAAAFATALIFVMVPTRLGLRGQNPVGIARVAWALVFVWVIAFYFVASEDSRLSGMEDTLMPLMISGFVGNWVRHNWIAKRSTVKQSVN